MFITGAIGLPCWIITSNNVISMTLFWLTSPLKQASSYGWQISSSLVLVHLRDYDCEDENLPWDHEIPARSQLELYGLVWLMYRILINYLPGYLENRELNLATFQSGFDYRCSYVGVKFRQETRPWNSSIGQQKWRQMRQAGLNLRQRQRKAQIQ